MPRAIVVLVAIDVVTDRLANLRLPLVCRACGGTDQATTVELESCEPQYETGSCRVIGYNEGPVVLTSRCRTCGWRETGTDGKTRISLFKDEQ